jgi:hypothetical protein
LDEIREHGSRSVNDFGAQIAMKRIASNPSTEPIIGF